MLPVPIGNQGARGPTSPILASARAAPVTDTGVAFYNRWGRPVRFTVTDGKGQRYSMSGTDLRSAASYGAPSAAILPSSFFTLGTSLSATLSSRPKSRFRFWLFFSRLWLCIA